MSQIRIVQGLFWLEIQKVRARFHPLAGLVSFRIYMFLCIHIYIYLSLSLCEYSHIESKLLRATAAVESNICPQELRLLLLQKLFDHCC